MITKLEETQVFVIIKQDKNPREDSMNISYEPLWNLLKSRNMKKKDLLERANLTTNCIANMGKNEYISLRNIERICEALNCKIEDVIKII